MVMAVCQQTGMSLLDFQSRYHVRQGRISMQAHAMLAEFVSRGGTFKMVERSPNRACIVLTKDGNEYISELSWADALQEPFIYAGNETDQLRELSKPLDQRKLKAKYQTPRSRMQMLWARVISDGVGTLDPGARQAYTPEETEDFQPDQRRETVVSAAELNNVIDVPLHEVQSIPDTVKTVGESNTEKLKRLAAEKKAAINAPVDNLALDYSVCPVAPRGAQRFKGMKWDKMELFVLESALTAAKAGKYPEITAEHQEAIQYAIDGKRVAV
jgi:hypothetical protein